MGIPLVVLRFLHRRRLARAPAARVTAAMLLLVVAGAWAGESFAQQAMSLTRTGTRDTLFHVDENGFVGVGTTSPELLHFPGLGQPFGRRQGLARFSIRHNRANAPDGNYVGLSAMVSGNIQNTVNLIGLYGVAAGTNDTTIGVYGRGAGVGTVPSIGGFFEAHGAGVGDNIAGYFSARGLGNNYGIWADADWLPAVFNRLQDEGSLVSFRIRDSERASIGSHGDFVSLNEFTSTNVALVPEPLERGTVVSAWSRGSPIGDEPPTAHFTVRTSPRANDPTVWGAYLASFGTRVDESGFAECLVMNGGKGRVWVIDTGRDLQTGDLLVTSHIPGHAMRDPGIFALSHVFARVARPVNWEHATSELKGHRRAIVDVMFERSVVNHAARRLEAELDVLSDRIDRLETLVRWLELPPDIDDEWEWEGRDPLPPEPRTPPPDLPDP